MMWLALLLAGTALQAAAMPSEEPGGDDTTVATEFETVIARLGLSDVVSEYSDTKKISIGKPACAYINITGTDKMPEKKTEYMNVYMDVYTDDGAHFLKRAIISAQGNSSLAFPKKNFKADFCEDEWVGDATTSITIGEWVKQDGFHFKSYYIDWLRGAGVVGYQLYDQIALNTGRPWTRAAENIAKPKADARCYPDGFPCIVYLNGDFYGIFAWQLKKHRDNMNQTKTVAAHIHLDGKIGNDTFWNADSISWKEFEVRNPKSLYTMDGQKYDGDDPKELIDESSEFFFADTDDDATREAKERTAQTKHYIEALRQVYNQIESLRQQQGSTDEVRSLIEEHFDLPSLIDYACFHLAVNNWDGFRKNWQWFTYDGNRWFVTPYDLDCIFGNYFTGNFIVPAERTWINGGSAWLILSYGPFAWLNVYYADRVENRYKELREAGIIDSENISRLLDDWYYAVSDFYVDEWLRWPDSKCISETIVNDGWKQIDTGYNSAQWNDSTVYQPGDRCTLNSLAWEATDVVKGVKPFAQIGYHDSLERYKEWVSERIGILDAHFNYHPTTTEENFVFSASSSSTFSVYDVAGRLVATPSRGLNIYRYADGRTRKVFR